MGHRNRKDIFMADPLFLGWLRKQSGRSDDVGCLSRAVIDGVLDPDSLNSYVLMSALTQAKAEHRHEVDRLRQAATASPARRAATTSTTCPGCRRAINGERSVAVLSRRSGVADEGDMTTWHATCFEARRTSRPAPRSTSR
jgi:hypothetical protein